MLAEALSQIVCSKCRTLLNTQYMLPRLLPGSGDTVCQQCAQDMIEHSNPDQPLTLEDFPLNQTLIRILNSQQIRLTDPFEKNISRLLSDFEGDIPDNLTTSFDEQPLNRSTPPHPSNETRRNKVKKSRSTIRMPQRNRKRDSFVTTGKRCVLVDDDFDDVDDNDSNFSNHTNRHNESSSSSVGIRRGNWCNIHKKSAEVVCIQCREMICANCALFGTHKGHNISQEEDVMIVLTERANDIMNKVEQIKIQLDKTRQDRYDEIFKSEMLDFSKVLVNKIMQEFNSLRKEMDKLENSCLDEVHKHIQQKAQKWQAWWESQHQIPTQIQSGNEWCQQARSVIESLAEMKSKRYPYWDMLQWSETIKSKGYVLQRELNSTESNLEKYIEDSLNNTIITQFNQMPVSVALENFCRITKPSQKIVGNQLSKSVQQSRAQLIHVQSIKESQVNAYEQMEDSDLLCNQQQDNSNRSLEIDLDIPMMTISQFNEYNTNSVHHDSTIVSDMSKQTIKNNLSSVSKPPKQSQMMMRNNRNLTPTIQLDTVAVHSLSPINQINNQTQNQPKLGQQRKKLSVVSSLPQKYQMTIESLRIGSQSDQVVDFQGIDFTNDMAVYFGTEAKYWKVKTLKLMKCKISDEQLELFFQCLGGFNDNLQNLNLAQNLLSDRAVDILKELGTQGLINKNLKNIIVTQNRINGRKCQAKITDLKRVGLILTL